MGNGMDKLAETEREILDDKLKGYFETFFKDDTKVCKMPLHDESFCDVTCGGEDCLNHATEVYQEYYPDNNPKDYNSFRKDIFNMVGTVALYGKEVARETIKKERENERMKAKMESILTPDEPFASPDLSKHSEHVSLCLGGETIDIKGMAEKAVASESHDCEGYWDDDFCHNHVCGGEDCIHYLEILIANKCTKEYTESFSKPSESSVEVGVGVEDELKIQKEVDRIIKLTDHSECADLHCLGFNCGSEVCRTRLRKIALDSHYNTDPVTPAEVMSTTTPIILKPCIRCGGEAEEGGCCEHVNEVHWISCEDCYLRTAEWDHLSEAKTDWNDRPNEKDVKGCNFKVVNDAIEEMDNAWAESRLKISSQFVTTTSLDAETLFGGKL